MTFVRRFRAPLAAAVCLAAAALLALLAVDARAWQHRIARDDLRFRALPGHVGLWRTPSILPGDPAKALLGLSDALSYRHALQLFWYSRVGADPESQADLMTIRVDTATLLQRMLDHGATATERSNAANLLGVMTVLTPAADSTTQMKTLHRSAGFFRQAIATDAGNVAAKANLELVLRIVKLGKSRFGKDARGGFGFGRGRGANVGGSGF